MQKIKSVTLRCKRAEFKNALYYASVEYSGKFEILAIIRKNANLLPDEIFIIIQIF